MPMVESLPFEALSPPTDHYCGGEGSCIVLLHGLGGTWHIWQPVLQRLTARHRILAITLPGHFNGVDIPAGRPVSVVQLADTLIVRLRELGISQAHVVGNSLGGWLSLELLRRGVAQSVTAFSPAGGWTTVGDYDAIARPIRLTQRLLPWILPMLTLILRFAWIRRYVGRQTMEHADRVPGADFVAALRAVARTTILPALLDAMRNDGPVKPLPTTDAPIRIVWSARDRVIPFHTYGQAVVDATPRAQLRHLPDAGHVPMYDDPEGVVMHILEVVAQAEQHIAALGSAE